MEAITHGKALRGTRAYLERKGSRSSRKVGRMAGITHADGPESSVRFDIMSMLVLAESKALLRHHRNVLCAAGSDLD